jgi:hypothetical protein
MVKKGLPFKAKLRCKGKKQPNYKVVTHKNVGKKKAPPREVKCCLKMLFRSIGTNALRNVATAVYPSISILSLTRPSTYLYPPLYFIRVDGCDEDNVPAWNQNMSRKEGVTVDDK